MRFRDPRAKCSRSVRDARFQTVCHAAAELMRSGQHVFSPIAHSHPIATYGLPTDWSYWEAYGRWHLERCDEVLVLMLDGWQVSVGVAAEIAIATELGKAVEYVAPKPDMSGFERLTSLNME